MSCRTTLQHGLVAALVSRAVVVAPAVARPIDRIDRFDGATPTPRASSGSARRARHRPGAPRLEHVPAAPAARRRGVRARRVAV